jgi:heptosyltransferase-2
MQHTLDLTVLQSNSLHISKMDISQIREQVRCTIKPGDRILILALSGIGDAIMFTPALSLLKSSFPKNEFHVLTMFKGIADIFSKNADITQVHFWDFFKESPLRTLRFLFSMRGRYSHTITAFPANRFHYAIVSRIIGSKHRIGHRYLHDSISQLNTLNTILLDERNELHNCEENIRIASLLGSTIPDELPAMKLPLSESDTSFAMDWIQKNGLENSDKILGIHAGSAIGKNQIEKRWKAEYYAELCTMASKQLDMTILLFGGPEEYALNARIDGMIKTSETKAIVHIVKTPSLTSSLAIMKYCTAFVSNDSGLMHCAAALQLPMIAIFGYTSHVHTAPWNNPQAVIARRSLSCSPCFYFSPKPASCQFERTDKAFTCIRDIYPIDIFHSLKEIIS